VRPGLTDAAAIAFRDEGRLLAGQSDVKAFYVANILPEKIRLYLNYVRGRSFWLDVKLILLTLHSILVRN
jgi:lipopolysaccharide/colanic/teichoic acid biosynthesis glycosyltransferase